MSSDEGPRFTAIDVPALRRELAEYYGSGRGAQYYYAAILSDRQPIRPPGPPEQVAPQLAGAEATRLRDGDLWYVDEDLCALLETAHPSMPAFAPKPHDLPSQEGFAVFAEPIAARAPADEYGIDEITDHVNSSLDPAKRAEFGVVVDRLANIEARIVAVSWGPVSNPNWTAGGLWMSFYSESAMTEGVFDDPVVRRRAAAMMPRLIVDNEATFAWRPDGVPVEEFMLPGPDEAESTLSWARLVFATFQLAAQDNLAETAHERTPRPERRRTQHAGLAERDVRVIRLRRGLVEARAETEPDAGGRAWRHRWVVRGHWRNQWYPSLDDHRPKWIAPYLKGPTDAPLLGGDKVTVVSTETETTPPDSPRR